MQILVTHNIQIKKRYIDNRLQWWLIQQLTLDNPEYTKESRFGRSTNAPKHIVLYETSRNSVSLPRGFLYKLLKHLRKRGIQYTVKNKTRKRANNNVRELPPVSTWYYQSDAVEEALRVRQGLIVMPCGSGKTRSALEFIRRAGQTTLVIVGSTFLVTQWREYIRELFDVEAGLIQQKTYNIKPITVATIQTLQSMYSRGELDRAFFRKFGCVVVDEVHHVSASSYQNIVNKFPAQYRIGTTATAERTDGLTRLIFDTMGQTLYKISAKRLSEEEYLIQPEIRFIDTPFTFARKTKNFNTILSRLIKDHERNKIIVQNLITNDKHYNIVLSNRIEHLETLARMYSVHSDNYEIITSKVNQVSRNEIVGRMQAGELHTIFATQLADEGLDIPILDRAHFVTPSSGAGRLEQRIGRLQRFYPNKQKPIVYDYLDNFVPMLRNMYWRRYNIYRRLKLINTRSRRKKGKQGRFKEV